MNCLRIRTFNVSAGLKVALLGLCFLFATQASVQAATLFTDGFDNFTAPGAATPGNFNQCTPVGWTVTQGSGTFYSANASGAWNIGNVTNYGSLLLIQDSGGVTTSTITSPTFTSGAGTVTISISAATRSTNAYLLIGPAYGGTGTINVLVDGNPTTISQSFMNPILNNTGFAVYTATVNVTAGTHSVALQWVAPTATINSVAVSDNTCGIDSVEVDGPALPPASVVTTPTGTLPLPATALGTAGASASYTISATNLTGAPGNITVTAPSNVLVSTDGTNFSGSVMVAYTSGTLASTPLYAELAGTGTPGTISGNIAYTGGGLSGANQAVVGLLEATGSAPAILTDNAPETTGVSGSATLGWTFTVGSANLTVTGLGVWDFGADGLIDSHAVGIFDSNGTLVVSTTIQSGVASPISGGYRYEAVESIQLTAGQTYTIGAVYPESSDQLIQYSSQTFSPQLTYGQPEISGGSNSLTVPTISNGGAQGFFGPNFLFIAPTITVPGGTTTLTSTIVGVAGASSNFSISASNLNPAGGSITATAPANVEVSSDNTTFGATATFPYTNGALASTPVYVRLAGTGTPGPITGNVGFTGGGVVLATNQAVSGTLNPAITIASGPTANPSPAIADVPVSFSVTVTVPANPTITWDFGDGMMGTGATPTHIYTTAGTYTVTVTVTDPTSMTSMMSMLTLIVNDLQFGQYTDLPNTQQLYVTYGRIRIYPGLLQLQGITPLPLGTNLNGATFVLKVNGLTRTFTLNKVGQGQVSDGHVAIIPIKSSMVREADEMAKFRILLLGNTMIQQLSTNVGLDAKGRPLKLVIEFMIAGQTASYITPMQYIIRPAPGYCKFGQKFTVK